MGIFADYRDGLGGIKKNSYIKIHRIWGSKQEGWNAWVNVYTNKGDRDHTDQFHLMADYVEDGNPFVLLYSKLQELEFISNIENDTAKNVQSVVKLNLDTELPEGTELAPHDIVVTTVQDEAVAKKRNRRAKN